MPSTISLHYLLITGSPDSLVKLIVEIIFFQKCGEVPVMLWVAELVPYNHG